MGGIGKHPHKRLTAIAIANAKPGTYADGNGLYLVVEPSLAKHWIFRAVINGTPSISRRWNSIRLASMQWRQWTFCRL